MSQHLATYKHSYSTRSCRQQCYYSNGIVATENVLAAVSGDGHEVDQNFTLNHEDNSRLHTYKILQQQIIGHTIQSVDDIEKWLRYTSEHILNSELNAKNNSQVDIQRGLNEQLSQVSDKQLLTDIELTAKKLNIDYDAILAELQNNKITMANEKEDELILTDIHLDDLLLTQEIQAAYSHSEYTNTDLNFENLADESQLDNNVEQIIEIPQLQMPQLQSEINSVQMNENSTNIETELIVKKDSFDSALTISIQDLSIENDSRDELSNPNNCTYITNESRDSKSENSNLPVVARKKSKKSNISTNSSKGKTKFEPSIMKRKRKVTYQEIAVETDEKNTTSTNCHLNEKSLKENSKTFMNKSSRPLISECSGSDSDDVHKNRTFVTPSAQELVISNALKEAGITEDSLTYYYTSDNIKTWRCHLENCGRDFAKLSYLKVHLMSHLNLKPFKCDYPGCTWGFCSEFKLKRHKTTHLNKKDFACSVPGCQRRFTTVYNLASHKKMHARPNEIVCQVLGCTEKFQTQRALDNHMKCHGESLAPYNCKYKGCPKRFYSTNALMTHQRSHCYSEEDLTCPWPDCGKIFDQPCRKKAHMRTHTGQKPYVCSFKGCNWAFTTSSKLSRHQKKHTNERKFECDEEGCTKSFLRSQHLKEHKLTHIEERTPYQCHFCDASFVAKSSLYVHMKNHADKNYVHKQQKKGNANKKTDNCDKNYAGSSGSESTSNEETENISSISNNSEMPTTSAVLEKIYKCPMEYCSKLYSHRSSLRIHLQKHKTPTLAQIQNDVERNNEESTTSSTSKLKPNEGAARTEFPYEYVPSVKRSVQETYSSEINTVKLGDNLFVDEDLPSAYCQDEVGLVDFQMLLFDTNTVDDIQEF